MKRTEHSTGSGMPTIALGGDTMLGRMVGWALLHRSPAAVWDQALLDVFGEADAAIVNLECCISERGEPWPAVGKQFFFRAPPIAVEALAAAGVRAVWLANNHALDFGEVALLDTFRYLDEAGIAWAGAGRDIDEARRGVIISVKGARVGLLGFADHAADYAATASSPGIAWVDSAELARRGPPDWLLAEIRRLATSCKVVVIGPHWGPNMQLQPLPHHPALARALVAAGASLLSGHSAHVVQPVDLIDGVPICYDVGDLLDDYALDEELRNDLGLLALFTPAERLELVPLRLEYCHTRLATGADHTLLSDRLLSAARDSRVDLRPANGRLVLAFSADAADVRGEAAGWHAILPHTADAGLTAQAESLPLLFEHAAAALAEMAAEVEPGAKPSLSEHIDLEADDLPGLAYAWLNELIGLSDVHRSAVVTAVVERLEPSAAQSGEPWRLRARVDLAAYGGLGISPVRQLKSATYHGLSVQQRRREWVMEAYVDI